MSVDENLKDCRRNARRFSSANKNHDQDRKFTAEELAPDGGWGWAVVAGVTLSNMVCFCGATSFGMIVGDFLTENGNDGSSMTLLNVMGTISFATAGIFCNELLKKYNIKSIGVFGAFIYALGSISIALMPSVGWMALTMMMQGAGMGTIVTICNTSLNSYFVKRRAMVFTMTQVFVSTGAVFYPFLAEYFLSTYGFRGCLIIVGGISLNGICGMLTIEPVESHYKKPRLMGGRLNRNNEASDKNFQDNFDIDKKIETTTNRSEDRLLEWNKNMQSLENLKTDTETQRPLLESTQDSNQADSHFVPDIDSAENAGSPAGIAWQGSNQDIILRRLSVMGAVSISSVSGIGMLGDMGQQIVDTDANDEDPGKAKRKILSVLSDFFEISLLRDGVFINICLGLTATFISDTTFNNFFPLILANTGFTTSDIALTLTSTAVAELISRICLVIFAMFSKTKSRHIVFLASCLLCLSKVAFLFCDTLPSVIAVAMIMSYLRSWYFVMQGLVLAEHFDIQRFPAAFSLCTICNGFFTLSVVPLIGMIKDWTNSYIVVQYILVGIQFLCIIAWAVEMWIIDLLPRRCRNKNNIVVP